MRVTLKRGTGGKTKYNGQTATLTANSRSGGWAQATPAGCVTPIKWRSGHWEEIQDEDVGEPHVLSGDVLGKVFAQNQIWDRMRALSVSKTWAQVQQDPVAWREILTPLDASSFTAPRMVMLLDRAGSAGPLVLDFGCDVGRTTQSVWVDEIEHDSPVHLIHPLAQKLLHLGGAGRLSCLHTLRIRYALSWVSAPFVTELLPRCPALTHLQLKIPAELQSQHMKTFLPRLCLPTLRILHNTFVNGLSRPDHSDGELFPSKMLPLMRCPALHTLVVANCVHGYGHGSPLFPANGLPASLKCLKITMPGGSLHHFTPRLPHLEHLYIRMLKTNGPVGCLSHLSMLQAVHIDLGHVYTPPALKQLYESLSACIHLRYLRIDARGADDSNLEGDDSPLPALKALTETLPDLYFIQVPHDLPDQTFCVDGWVGSYIQNEPSRYSDATDEYTRLVRSEAEFHDARHLKALADDFATLLPEFNMESHPSTSPPP